MKCDGKRALSLNQARGGGASQPAQCHRHAQPGRRDIPGTRRSAHAAGRAAASKEIGQDPARRAFDLGIGIYFKTALRVIERASHAYTEVGR